MSRESYDRIAAVYDTDMGRSMPFDDIGFYRRLCAARGGSVLELGCGTGRILLPLLASGIDIDGIDQSEGMLAELRAEAARRGLQPTTAVGSLQSFVAARRYRTVLCPYAVLTYLTTPAELADCLQRVAQALEPEGLLVVDTFIPRDVTAFDDFRLDYRRPHGAATLQREKRIAREGDCNRIERRYSLLAADGSVERSWVTCDVIRPWQSAELVAAAAGQGLQLRSSTTDFGAVSASPQFIVLQFGLR